MKALVAAACALVAAVAPARARADVDYFKAAQKPNTVTYTTSPPRTSGERLLIGGLVAGSLIAGAIGVSFNLESRDAADAVSANGMTGKTWTPDLQATADRAHSEGVKAGVMYGIGGAFLIAAAVAFFETEKPEQTVEIKPTGATAIVAPVPGGAVVGASWGW